MYFNFNNCVENNCMHLILHKQQKLEDEGRSPVHNVGEVRYGLEKVIFSIKRSNKKNKILFNYIQRRLYTDLYFGIHNHLQFYFP